MNEQPLVSVIVSSYNHARYVELCIKSVLDQSYRNIELLVVDDGSTDNSVECIRRLQHQYGFDFVVQQNRGLSRTLNEVIARSRGSLIAPFGSDDIMVPDRLEKQVAYLSAKPEVGICAGNIQKIDENGDFLEEPKSLPMRRLDFEDIFLNRKAGAPAPTLLYRREALDKVGGFEKEIRLEDLVATLKIAYAGYYIDVLPDIMAFYRTHSSNTYKNYRFMVDNVLKTYKLFDQHPQYERVCLSYYKSMFLKCSNKDKVFARELLGSIPLSRWDRKTLRGIFRLLWPC